MRTYRPGVAVLHFDLRAFAVAGDVLREGGLQAAVAGVEAVAEVGVDARFAPVEQAGIAAAVRFERVAVVARAQGEGLRFAVVEFDAGRGTVEVDVRAFVVQERRGVPVVAVVVFVHAAGVTGGDAEAEAAVAAFSGGMDACREGKQGEQCGFAVVHGVS